MAVYVSLVNNLRIGGERLGSVAVITADDDEQLQLFVDLHGYKFEHFVPPIVIVAGGLAGRMHIIAQMTDVMVIVKSGATLVNHGKEPWRTKPNPMTNGSKSDG